MKLTTARRHAVQHTTLSERNAAATTKQPSSSSSAQREGVSIDRFESSAVASRVTRFVGSLDRLDARTAELARPYQAEAARSHDAAARVDGSSMRDKVKPGRNASLGNDVEDDMQDAAGAVAGLGAAASTLPAALSWGKIPVTSMLAGGAAGVTAVTAVAATTLGAAIFVGRGVDRLIEWRLGQPLGTWAHEKMYPDEYTDGAEQADASGASGEVGATSLTGGPDETGGASDEVDGGDDGSSDSADDAASTESADGSAADDAVESSDNDDDGKDDKDGTTPVDAESGGPYVPVSRVTGGRLGKEQEERDRDAIDAATGGTVTDPVDSGGEGGGGGVSQDAFGGGHDRPERDTEGALETNSIRHAIFQLTGGGTINPAALRVAAGLRG